MTGPADPLPGVGGPVRLRLDLAYDGTDFSGWARQPGRRTVQEVLEAALATALRVDPVRATCAGRTDAGVHARGQVVHVDVPAAAYEAVAPVLADRVSGLLPADVRARGLAPAATGFDARFSALWRRYSYRACDDRAGVDPLRRRHVLAHGRPLDLDAMAAASEPLVGEHDFAAFCRRRDGATTVRRLLGLTWSRDEAGDVVAEVTADAFCHSMVRSLVGALLAVGDGRRDVAWPARVLAGRERVPDVAVAAALGLTLEEVSYPPDAELAERAAATRRRRDLPEVRA